MRRYKPASRRWSGGWRFSRCTPGSSSGAEPTRCCAGSEVENSVILEGCVIDRVGARIDGSLLGRGVVLERAPERPRAISLVLGDQSRARIV